MISHFIIIPCHWWVTYLASFESYECTVAMLYSFIVVWFYDVYCYSNHTSIH